MTEVHKISTPATGLETLEARIPRRDGEAPAYLAKPAGADNCPIILIAQEIFGLNDHIRDIARRFAALGYLAIAPDFFAGVGDPSRAPDMNAIRAIVAKTPDAATMEVFDAALAFAAAPSAEEQARFLEEARVRPRLHVEITLEITVIA